MRTLQTLSYSGLSLWESRPDEHYLKYLSEKRPPRTLQEQPAAVGSAFDAIAKSSLHSALFGAGNDPKYTLEALFEAQVEAQNRDWAMPEGRYVFDCYRESGFYTELLMQLLASREPPRFEFEVSAELNGVPFLGKPDARWISREGVHIIHDWKVNGYKSKNTTSPHKSYRLCRDGYKAEKQSKSHNTEHKEFMAVQHFDTVVNASYMEVSNPAWADQLTLYGWALGEGIGDENVVLSVHQIVAKPTGVRPQLRVAAYSARVAAAYQAALAERLKKCWDAITSGHIFPALSREDSDARCAVLDDTAVGLQSDGSSLDNYFSEATREAYRG
jgi:hypothetical protein